MATTTIKVDSAVRDRLNELAASQGCSAGSMVERLLEEYLWRQQVDLAVLRMNSMSEQERQEYAAELAQWDSTLGDGRDAP